MSNFYFPPSLQGRTEERLILPLIKQVPPEIIDGKIYYADSDGNIRNAKGKILKPLFAPSDYISRPNMHGAYPRVVINKKSRNVHSLVCTAFWGLPLPNHVCHHLDGNKFNNRPANLIWLHRSVHPKYDRLVRQGIIFQHRDPLTID